MRLLLCSLKSKKNTSLSPVGNEAAEQILTLHIIKGLSAEFINDAARE
jgi:hypothetical protein